MHTHDRSVRAPGPGCSRPTAHRGGDGCRFRRRGRHVRGSSAAPARPRGRRQPPPLQLTDGTESAASAHGIGDDVIRTAIADLDEIEPNPAGCGRMRLRRRPLRVALVRDGALLSFRDRKPHHRSWQARRHLGPPLRPWRLPRVPLLRWSWASEGREDTDVAAVGRCETGGVGPLRPRSRGPVDPVGRTHPRRHAACCELPACRGVPRRVRAYRRRAPVLMAVGRSRPAETSSRAGAGRARPRPNPGRHWGRDALEGGFRCPSTS